MRKLLIGGLVLAVIAAGLGYAAMRFLGPARDNAVEMVPEGAFVYANVFLNPSTGQKMALEDLLAKFPQAGTPDEATHFIADLIDEGFASEGIDATFEDDIEPWLGHQAAIFFLPPETETADPSGAVLIATEDGDATMDFVRKFDTNEVDIEEASYDGVDYFRDTDGEGVAGVVGEFLIIGNEDGFKAVVDAPDEGTLAESDRYEKATAELRRDRVALAYFDPKPFVDLARRTGELPPNIPPAFTSLIEEPFVASMFLRSDAFIVELAQTAPSGPLAAITDSITSEGNLDPLPVNSWGAFTIPKFGQTLEAFLDAFSAFGLPGVTRLAIGQAVRSETGFDLERDILAWPGDLAGFVQGTDLRTLGGGLVVESRDPEASAGAFAKLQLLLRRRGAPVRELGVPGYRGFAVQDRFMPQPVNFIEDRERIVVVYGNQATQDVLSPGPLGGSQEFAAAQEALGSDFSMSFYLSVHPILRLAENLGAESSPEYQQAKLFLEPIEFATAGSKLSGDSIVQRFVIGVP